MIKFTPTTLIDVPQITEWIQADPYHRDQGRPEWWVGSGALLAFCLSDDAGPLTFVRLDREGEYVRIHTQFAPLIEVSKRRLLVGMVYAMEELIEIHKNKTIWDPIWKGMIFESVNPSLVAFMDKRFGFKSVGDDDYRLDFEGQ